MTWFLANQAAAAPLMSTSDADMALMPVHAVLESPRKVSAVAVTMFRFPFYSLRDLYWTLFFRVG